MKKIALMLCACAALSFGFSSCEENQGPGNGNGNGNGGTNFDEVIEDGFYVAGAATGSEELVVDYMMAAGQNEVDGKARPGMYEKYVALEANKDFSLLLYEAGVETRYSAKLDTFNTNGENDQPTVTLWRGALETGETAPAMQVAESGLYHIVLDLNKANDLANPQIIVAPVQWGTRGINGDWGWKAMTTPEFNRTSMTFVSVENFRVEAGGDFKFAYGGGWKIQLDDAGKVKANTNLGNDAADNGADLMPNNLVPNGKNIAIGRGVWKIELTWKLAAGSINNSYEAKFTLVEALPYADPSTFLAGFSGDGVACGWNDPSGDAVAVYNATESKITDETTKTGTYVYDVANVAMIGGKEFKVRYNGAWLGADSAELTIEGEKFEGTGNFKIPADANYKVRFSVEWDGNASKAKSIKVVFAKL